MAGFIVITQYSLDNRVEKAQLTDPKTDELFKTRAEGQAFIDEVLPSSYLNAFVTSDPGDTQRNWLVDPIAKTVSISPPPPDPDPQGTDPQAPGYDPDYANNFPTYRKKAYNEAGVTNEAMMVATWESLMQGAPDNRERDRLQAVRQSVKTRFPKPS